MSTDEKWVHMDSEYKWEESTDGKWVQMGVSIQMRSEYIWILDSDYRWKCVTEEAWEM